jgi:hypothetical protein
MSAAQQSAVWRPWFRAMTGSVPWYGRWDDTCSRDVTRYPRGISAEHCDWEASLPWPDRAALCLHRIEAADEQVEAAGQ